MKKLEPKDIARAAAELGCSGAAIKAVVKVESPRGGFNPDGTLTTLFEAHHFHRFTKGRWTETHPRLSSRAWDRSLYARSWQGERQRYAEAAALDPISAILSTSYGMFQIMGFNHGLCGFTSGADMVNAFATGEGAQLDAFVEFIKVRGLADELRDLRWLDFALAYNGPSARVLKYDLKIAAAYSEIAGG
jgi:hypothetical protein